MLVPFASRVGRAKRAPPRSQFEADRRAWWGSLRSTHPTYRRRGFTLLEILLALMLSTMVLSLLWMAVDFHLRVSEKGRVQVEEARLARTLLHLIANDLTCAVAPPTSSGSTSASTSTSTSSGDTSATSSATDTSSLADSVIVQTAPGLYGSVDSFQVDVYRVPRLDEYQDQDQLETSTEMAGVDRTSAVKTVTYYVIAPDAGNGGQTGLVRRELDRAVTVYAELQGALDTTVLETGPLAPEVVAAEFLYYDGAEWVDTWDSQSQGCLPAAVRVSLALVPSKEKSDDEMDFWTVTSFQDLVNRGKNPIYRLTVSLPNAKASASATTASTVTATTSGEESEL